MVLTEGLTGAEPACAAGIEDRAADCWEPLLAIADVAGAIGHAGKGRLLLHSAAVQATKRKRSAYGNGGGGSHRRTCLCFAFPCCAGKYREILGARGWL